MSGFRGIQRGEGKQEKGKEKKKKWRWPFILDDEVNGFADFHAIDYRSRSYRSGIWPDDCRASLYSPADGSVPETG